MTTHELIELAVLDALALLDEHESAEFERAFRAAPPQLQAQIRREQTRFSNIEDLLPSVEPPADLRARVLAAVREAIGAPDKLHAAGRVVPNLPRARRVSRLWRAAALGFATAAVVLTVSLIDMRNSLAEVQRLVSSNAAVGAAMTIMGPAGHMDDMVHDPHAIPLQPASPEYAKARATVHYNPEWPNAEVWVRGIVPETGVTYRLVALDDQGNPTGSHTDLRLAGTGGQEHFDVTFPVTDGTRVAIVAVHADGTNEPVFLMA